MKIEAGKYYKTRDGRKVGPIVRDSSLPDTNCYWRAFECKLNNGFASAWYADGRFYNEVGHAFDLIAEWTDTPAEPKLWRDMTPAEKGALLLAHHEGKAIQVYAYDEWVDQHPHWQKFVAYRIKPADPVVETVTLAGRVGVGSEWSFGTGEEWPFDSHRITFNLINGKPDCDSIRMEAIE